ncbi:MAG: hypothetical protein HN383_10275 [Verrucomicrobia bacterium]|jgi:hypothetical protein|nr:hypothetical protein [Verrucomicrobiota bacterium]MBT7700641.1 hypothetical protein [Verrucomicrobiota bacterium]
MMTRNRITNGLMVAVVAMTKKLITLFAIAGMVLALAPTAHAALLSVDFNAGTVQTGFIAGTTSGASDGGITLGITGAGGIITRGAAVDGVDPGFTYANLYNDWLYGTSVDFSISGLDANTAYEITWYSYDDNNTVYNNIITAKAGSNTTGDTLLTTSGGRVPPKANDDLAFTGTWTSTTGTLDLTNVDAFTSGVRVNGIEISAAIGGGSTPGTLIYGK